MTSRRSRRRKAELKGQEIIRDQMINDGRMRLQATLERNSKGLTANERLELRAWGGIKSTVVLVQTPRQAGNGMAKWGETKGSYKVPVTPEEGHELTFGRYATREVHCGKAEHAQRVTDAVMPSFRKPSPFDGKPLTVTDWKWTGKKLVPKGSKRFGP